MEPEVPLPCSQQRAACLYPPPDQSTPRLPIIFKIHFNIIRPSTPRSSKISERFGFPQHNSVFIFLLSYTCHMPDPSHLLDLVAIIIFHEAYKSCRFSLRSFLPSPVKSSLLSTFASTLLQTKWVKLQKKITVLLVHVLTFGFLHVAQYYKNV